MLARLSKGVSGQEVWISNYIESVLRFKELNMCAFCVMAVVD